MDAAPPSGVEEEWSPPPPQVTHDPLLELLKRRACSDLRIPSIDCGNGACCPRESVCEITNGITNCRGTLSNLPGGTAVVPGFTVSTLSSTAASSASSDPLSTVQSDVFTSTSSTPPEASTVTQTTTAEVSSVSTETVTVAPSSLSTSATTISSAIESLTSTTLINNMPTPSPKPTPAANAGSDNTGIISSSSAFTSSGLSAGAAVGIAISVGIIAFGAVLIAFIIYLRRSRENNQNQTPTQLTTAAAGGRGGTGSPSVDSERGTATLPRGGEKTFSDVVEASRYDAPRSSYNHNDAFVYRPEMTAIGGGRSYGSSDRVYDQGSPYDRERDYYETRGYSRNNRDSVSTARTSRGFLSEEDLQYFSGSSDTGGRQQRLRQSSVYSTEFDVPEPAATYLRDPFASPDDNPRAARQAERGRPPPLVAGDAPSPRSASPRRYLYPEPTDFRDGGGNNINHEEGEEEDEQGHPNHRAESRGAGSVRSGQQRVPVNYLPVFQPPVYAVLPGTSGEVVEMI